jgi:mannose-6-phosphate isomerase-like protein (cupin superfamily)
MARGFSIVNLKDVEDAAEGFGFAPDMEARFAGGALDLEESGFSYQRLAPNFRTPWGHRHERQEELYLILSGSGRMKLDDQIIQVKPWDAIRVPSEQMRAFEAGDEGLELLAFGAPRVGPARDDVKDMTPGWWSDEGSGD